MENNKILPGIDFFLNNKIYSDKRIGLITNQTGITSKGIPTWKALLDKGYKLSSLFGPEHGFRGEAQDAVPVEDSTFMGIKTYSLYGKRISPTKEMVGDIDILLYDIQDIGSRYYTYLYTLANSMNVCQNSKTKVIVLDRPNPIGHYKIEGNSIDEEYNSFVGAHGLTNVYGLTIGEFALYIKKYYYQNIELEVIPVQNYTKSIPFDKTGLPWISPSPNMPSLNTAAVYPGTCLFEGTNISEGRGTTRPFEIIGAPWIDGENLRQALSELNLPGVSFSSLFFTPVFSKYKGELCQGICIHILDRKLYRPLYSGLAILHTIKLIYPNNVQWKQDWENDGTYFLDRLTGSIPTRKMLDNKEGLGIIYKSLTSNSSVFTNRQKEVLIY